MSKSTNIKIENEIYDNIKSNKNTKKILIIILILGFICISFFLIYKYNNPKITICTLKQNYPNYKNNINIKIIRDEALIQEIFTSDEEIIINNKKEELLKDNYKVNSSTNKLISTKTITKKDIADEYLKYGYTCDNETNKINIKFNLKNNTESIEVKNEYNEEIEAIVNKKDYSKKVIITNNINKEKLGKYLVIYTLPISKYRNEVIYKIVEVKDTTSPTIKLKGKNTITIEKNGNYNEPGVEVNDNYDDKKSLKINISGNVDTTKTGEYIITYTVIDTSNNESSIERKVIVKEKNSGLTYIQGILVVNKKYSLPKDYNPGLLKETEDAYNDLAKAASSDGMSIPVVSGFRSYSYQETIYNNYIKIYGQSETDTFSARPGHSEHQTGLALDVGEIDDNYGETKEGKWLKENAHKYGFIIRYPKGKEHITGYKYEPWHIRYLGKETATAVYKSGLCLEEYLNIQ